MQYKRTVWDGAIGLQAPVLATSVITLVTIQLVLQQILRQMVQQPGLEEALGTSQRQRPRARRVYPLLPGSPLSHIRRRSRYTPLGHDCDLCLRRDAAAVEVRDI